MKTKWYLLLSIAAALSFTSLWISWQLLAVIIFVVLAFAALVTYSVWYLWFGPEAVFSVPANQVSAWRNITYSRVFLPAKGTPYDNSEANYELKKKLEKMEARRNALLQELIKKYDGDKLREVNILSHKIEVANARLSGRFNRAEAQTDEYLIVTK
jgi:hypothetical protein